MNFFEEATLRLKQQLETTQDKDVAAALGLSAQSWAGRKKRSNFPEKELRALAQQRPELALDVDYVLTGVTEQESLRQRDALHEAGGISKAQRDAHKAEVAMLAAWRRCAPEDQALVLQTAQRLARR